MFLRRQSAPATAERPKEHMALKRKAFFVMFLVIMNVISVIIKKNEIDVAIMEIESSFI
jgi:hypothetical protein